MTRSTISFSILTVLYLYFGSLGALTSPSINANDNDLLRYYLNSVKRPEPLYAEYEFIEPVAASQSRLQSQAPQQSQSQKQEAYQKSCSNFEQKAHQTHTTTHRLAPRIIKAAVITRYSVEDQTQDKLTQKYFTSEPISIEVESRHNRPMIIHFRSPKRPIHVKQSFGKSEMPEDLIEKTSTEDQPIRLYHEVTRPIIQEVHEQILPRRKVVQELRPVEEEIRTIIASAASETTTENMSEIDEKKIFDNDDTDFNSDPVYNKFEKDYKSMNDNNDNKTKIEEHDNHNLERNNNNSDDNDDKSIEPLK